MGEFRPSRPGERRGGRQKGVPNKTTTDLRQMILNALDKAGGEEYLVKASKENMSAFLTLAGKVLPTQLTGKDGGPIKSEVSFEERKRLAGAVWQAAFGGGVANEPFAQHEEAEDERKREAG